MIIGKKIKQSIVSHLLITATLLTSGFIVNCIQLLLHICVKPFSRTLFYKLLYYISWTWLAQCVFVIDFWSNSQLILYCKKEDYEYFGKEHNFTLINHSYEIDWLVGWLLIDKFHGLGCTRGFIKNPIKYIPICGWFFGFAEHIFLQRSFDKDRKVIEQRISEYANYPTCTWMVITPEGTRFTKTKHETSIQFAKEKSIEPFKHHLIPRAGGFNVCIPLLKKYNCPVVYNLQLAFDKDSKTIPTLGNLLMGKPVTAHVFLERIPMETVEPTFEFLHHIYQKKDALQDSFHKFGNFYEGRGEKVVPGIAMKARPEILINTCVWVAVTMFLMVYYSIKLILAGKIILLTTVSVGITAILYLMLQNILRHSKVNKGSKYGTTTR